ncbi:molybdenum ABC transporter ATP-binding protein [Aurantimonas sp. VKM B-3413]|uniref:molybdenum ABC transporter ATP-binding protein n=1 Tax=Aurantimonas sp. VKM B-3413 TaxID=2779401 RepID=UPI001E3E9ADE|nr:molybdenum ABC transporter ATP-binding protein [Aurantimonas sp. VKM B-3413]MCB8836628.1 molybdenum ABC transporter ATP-binding protein [Aurantimonas sp. VKM B-3413]
MSARDGLAEDRASGVSVSLAGKLGAFSIDAAFEAPASGVTALFGPSGSGKTSLLRAIAGLTRLTGFVTVAGETWQDAGRYLPPHRRATGYVFQEASLFPHLSVEKNLTFGARRSPGGIDPAGLNEVVAMLGLAPLLCRATAALSGGERQRVALGRAILSRPKLLLMDEPLSALDRAAKDEILPYLERLNAGLSLPILYVSHDISEVERLADRIVVLEAGRVKAAGPLNAALTDVALGFVRDPHAAAVLPAKVVGFDAADELAELDLGGQRVFVDGSGPDEIGSIRRLRIEASDVSLTRETPALSTILNTLRVKILAIEPAAPAKLAILLALDGAEDFTFMATVTRRSAGLLALSAGDRLIAQIKSVSLATAPQAGG